MATKRKSATTKAATPKPVVNKSTAYKSDVPVNFAWHKVGDSSPDFSKVAHHEIYEVSPVLLMRSESRGVIPGFCVKYLMDYQHHNRKKGDQVFTDMSDVVVKDITHFYQVDQIPVEPSKVEKEPEHKANS